MRSTIAATVAAIRALTNLSETATGENPEVISPTEKSRGREKERGLKNGSGQWVVSSGQAKQDRSKPQSPFVSLHTVLCIRSYVHTIHTCIRLK